MSNTSTPLVRTGDSGFRYLQVEGPDAINVVAHLRETHADVKGRAFLIKLDHIIETLGARWEIKAPIVWEHLKSSFNQRFQEPDWCIPINGNAWIAVLATIGPRMGALKSAEIWYETGQFFVGDVSNLPPPLYEVVVDGEERLKLRLIELNRYFDRGEDVAGNGTVRVLTAFGEQEGGRDNLSVGSMHARETLGTPGTLPFHVSEITDAGDTPPASISNAMPIRESLPVGAMVQVERLGGHPATVMIAMAPSQPRMQSALLNISGRALRVTSVLEPVFEMKKLSIVGYRLEPTAIDTGANVQLDTRALNAVDWNDRELMDLANIEQGIKLMLARTPEQRKFLLVVPVAFSTLASTRGRARVTAEVAAAAQRMGMKVLFEIRGVKGVPSHRIVEIVSLIRPYCMTVVAHIGADMRAISALNNCNLSGVCAELDNLVRDEVMLSAYLHNLSIAAKQSVGACMIQGLANFREMAVARAAGVSHASVRPSALFATASAKCI